MDSRIRTQWIKIWRCFRQFSAHGHRDTKHVRWDSALLRGARAMRLEKPFPTVHLSSNGALTDIKYQCLSQAIYWNIMHARHLSTFQTMSLCGSQQDMPQYSRKSSKYFMIFLYQFPFPDEIHIPIVKSDASCGLVNLCSISCVASFSVVLFWAAKLGGALPEFPPLVNCFVLSYTWGKYSEITSGLNGDWRSYRRCLLKVGMDCHSRASDVDGRLNSAIWSTSLKWCSGGHWKQIFDAISATWTAIRSHPKSSPTIQWNPCNTMA